MGNLCLGPAENSRPTPHARPASRIDLNAAVDRLQLSDLKALQSRFAIVAAQQTPVGRRGNGSDRGSHGPGLTFAAFQQALPRLSEVRLDLQKAVFKAFNISYHEEIVDIRDFAGALAICRHGSRRQKLEFILRIFSFLRDAGGVWVEESAGVALTREQFDKLREYFHIPDSIVRDQPRSNGSVTTPPPQGSPAAGPAAAFASSETVPLESFLSWADGQPQLSNDRLSSFLSLLTCGAMDPPQRELARVAATLEQAAAEYGRRARGGAEPPPTEPVYLLSASWWHAWCDYVNAGMDVRGYPPPTGGSSGDTPPSRPNEVDNGDIGARLVYVVKQGIKEGTDFVVLPSRTWEDLWELYGGGPAFPRHCAFLHQQPQPATHAEVVGGEATSPHTPGDPPITPAGGNSRGKPSWHQVRCQLTVDVYPLLLQVSLCYRSTLIAPENKDLPFLISCRLTPYAELCHILSDFFLVDYDRNSTKTKARLWVMRTSRRLEKRGSGNEWMPVDWEGEGGGSTSKGVVGAGGAAAAGAGGASEEATESESATQQVVVVGSRGQQASLRAKSMGLNSGGGLRWEVVDGEAHRQGLQGVGLQHTDRLLIEIKEGDEPWPRDALIERPDFRDFKIAQRLDAIDYQGKCYSGAIVAIEELPAPIPPPPHEEEEATGSSEEDEEDDDGVPEGPREPGLSAARSKAQATETAVKPPLSRIRVKVHFDNFASKWDEWYPADSAKLCPEGSLTGNRPQQSSASRTLSPLRSRFRPSPVRDRTRSIRTTSVAGGVNGGRSSVDGGQTSMTLADAGKQLLSSLPSSVPGVPFRPGGCGLANLGNTCFLNSALQCLSHTPLLKSYFLSHQFERDINTKNVLGTQGRIAEEFAALLKALWGNEYLSISPSKFRRTLAKYKPQFAGNEQQDSQEFLTVMLDSLHEDVNRVIDKPYVQSPDDDEAEEKKPLQQLSAEAWDRHLKRNQSVIVDLFQGQVKCATSCMECGKRSLTFDPVQFLSVPVPVQTERFVKVTILPRVKTSHLPSPAASPPLLDPPSLRPVVYGMLLPRDATVSQVLSFLSEKSGVPDSRLLLVELGRHRIQRVIEPREPLSVLRDDDILVAFERLLPALPATATSGVLDSSIGGSKPEPQPTPAPPPRPASASPPPPPAQDPPPPPPPPPPFTPSTREAGSSETAAVSSSTTTSAEPEGRPGEEEEEQEEGVAEEEEDSELEEERAEEEGEEGRWPSELKGLRVGDRVDAVDYRGSWYVGSVVRVDHQPNSLVPRVQVHFDRFSSRWDEWYSAEDWQQGKLHPAYFKTTRKRRVFEAQVIHRRLITTGTSTRYTTMQPGAEVVGEGSLRRRSPSMGGSGGVGGGVKEVFGLPFFVHCDGHRTFLHLYWRVVKQALRFLSPEARQAALRALACKGGAVSSTNRQALPFTLRIVSFQQPTTSCGYCRAAGCQGCDVLPALASHVMCNQLSGATVTLSLDWLDPAAYYDALTRPVLDASFREVEAKQACRLGVTLADCLDEYTKEELLDEEACWRCSRCKALRKARRQERIWKLPDVLVIHIKRFLVAGRWRDKIRTRVDFPLEGLDLSPWLYTGEGSASRDLDAKDCVYDLFGVINHLGGMTGGHYTASCRSHSLNQQDGSTEGLQACATGVWKVSPTWLSFDDESVTALHADEIVTSSAYVLFYSRRRFRASNVLNTWANLHAD